MIIGKPKKTIGASIRSIMTGEHPPFCRSFRGLGLPPRRCKECCHPQGLQQGELEPPAHPDRGFRGSLVWRVLVLSCGNYTTRLR